MKWPVRKVGEIAELCLGKMLDQKKNKGGLRPYLANVNVRWGTFELDDLREMRFEDRELDRYGVRHGDIVMCEGGEPGRCAIWREQLPGMTVQKALHRVRAKDAVDHRYLYYSFLDHGRTGVFEQYFTGSTIKHLPGEKLALVEVAVPPIAVQRRIASILSAYDDLIENNTRRIAILEEMARRIYEEWFVYFRFPGHENVRMVESELGLMPEGWPIVRLDDVLVLQRGFDLPKQDRTEGLFPIVSATGVSGSHHEYRVKGPGVATGRSGSLGTVFYVEGDFWPLNTTLWVKDFKVGGPLYAYYVLTGIDLAGFNSGAAVPTLNRNDIHGLPVIKPPADLLKRFDELAGPMIKLKRKLESSNINLRDTRDLLLPKLISGELDVSEVAEPESGAA